jgi:hypothetical protein
LSLADIYKLKAEMGQPMPVEPTLDEADLERANREAAALGNMARGFAPPRGGRRPR